MQKESASVYGRVEMGGVCLENLASGKMMLAGNVIRRAWKILAGRCVYLSIGAVCVLGNLKNDARRYSHSACLKNFGRQIFGKCGEPHAT